MLDLNFCAFCGEDVEEGTYCSKDCEWLDTNLNLKTKDTKDIEELENFNNFE